MPDVQPFVSLSARKAHNHLEFKSSLWSDSQVMTAQPIENFQEKPLLVHERGFISALPSTFEPIILNISSLACD